MLRSSRRKIIPCFRSDIREASLTELVLNYWKFISESVRRFESPSAGQISGCRFNVRQVGRSTANMHQMHKYGFETLCETLPVQTPKRWSDVLSCSSASDESGGCILDPLQRIDWRLRKCCQNGVAVVHSGCHKSRHQTRRDIGTEDSTDARNTVSCNVIVIQQSRTMVWYVARTFDWEG